MAKTLRTPKAEASITCSAGYFYRQPVGLGRYFSGVAANDNHPLIAPNHGIYVALASLVALCAVLVSFL